MTAEGSARSALPEARAPGPLEGWEPSPPEGLYVHVPFCLSICPYCDFVVYAGSAARGPGSQVAALVDALHRELDLRTVGAAEPVATNAAATPGSGRVAPLGSLYFGGGTPSLLTAEAVGSLIEHVDRRLGLAADAEVTLEVNPGSDDRGDLRGFRAAGVTRLSVGAQALDDRSLRRLGRRHRAVDVADTVREARHAGFGSLGLDLLVDVPGQSLADWRSTLRSALALEPDHLSVYDLALDDPDAEGLTGPHGDHLPLRRGARRWREQARAAQSDDRAADMQLLADELADHAGLRRYEIANLARPGHESRHNLLYWRRRPYLALGPGAHASDGGLVRWWNAASLRAYLGSLQPADGAVPRLPPGGREVVETATAQAEWAILGLRLTEGLDGAVIRAWPSIARALDGAAGQGLVERIRGRVGLTQRGRALSNEVFAHLLPASTTQTATPT